MEIKVYDKIEKLNNKQRKESFKVNAHYNTKCDVIFDVEASNREDALKKAKERFELWNKNWVEKFNGNPKELIELEVLNK